MHTKTGRLSVAPNHRLYRQNSSNSRSLLQKFKRSSMFDRSSYVVYNTHRPYLVAPQLPSNLALRSTISSLFACLLLVCFRPMFGSFSLLLLKMLTVDHFPYPSTKIEFSTMLLCTPGISDIFVAIIKRMHTLHFYSSLGSGIKHCCRPEISLWYLQDSGDWCSVGYPIERSLIFLFIVLYDHTYVLCKSYFRLSIKLNFI